jgi:hypothetical protein
MVQRAAGNSFQNLPAPVAQAAPTVTTVTTTSSIISKITIGAAGLGVIYAFFGFRYEGNDQNIIEEAEKEAHNRAIIDKAREGAAPVAEKPQDVSPVSEQTTPAADQEVTEEGPAPEEAEFGSGRSGKQRRLRDLSEDETVSSAVRGWLKQEINAIKRGTRKTLRVPFGKNLVHPRGEEAAKGHGYERSQLNDVDLHKLQHKFDDKGRLNKPKPKPPSQPGFSGK